MSLRLRQVRFVSHQPHTLLIAILLVGICGLATPAFAYLNFGDLYFGGQYLKWGDPAFGTGATVHWGFMADGTDGTAIDGEMGEATSLSYAIRSMRKTGPARSTPRSNARSTLGRARPTSISCTPRPTPVCQ